MAAPTVAVYGNSSTTDNSHDASPGNFKTLTTGGAGDTLFWTGASATDGAASGTRDTITVGGSEVEIPKTFIDDASIIDQIPLAGTNQGGQQGGANQYVFCFHIQGETQSKPYLEVWDDSNHNTKALQCLGAGTPANSYIRGITTTNGNTAQANWVDDDANAVPMAGDGASDRLELDTAVIGGGGKKLYCNLAARVPGGASPFAENPVLTLRFSYN